jgi:multiple sugar transport system permease protein
MRSWRRPSLVSQAAIHLVLVVMCLVSVGPFVWLVFGSLKSYKELVTSRALLPQTWTLDNYIEIVNRVNFLAAFRNSVVVATVLTLTTCFTSAALGYVFAKYRFRGKELLFTLLLSTMMVPFAMRLVPLYIRIADLGLSDRLGGVIVPGFWSTFGIFLMRQFMETIPSELLDSAQIDGASEWRVFLTIVLPLSMAPLAALAIFNFLGSWDSFLWPLVVLNDPLKQTLPLVLASLRSLYWTRYDMWSAGAMLTVVPVMILYSFASRYFIQGLAMTGLKG